MPDYPVKNGAGADIVTGYDVDANPPTKRDYSGDYPVKNGLGQTIIASPPANTRTLPTRPDGARVVSRYPVKNGAGATILASAFGTGGGGSGPALLPLGKQVGFWGDGVFGTGCTAGFRRATDMALLYLGLRVLPAPGFQQCLSGGDMDTIYDRRELAANQCWDLASFGNQGHNDGLMSTDPDTTPTYWTKWKRNFDWWVANNARASLIPICTTVGSSVSGEAIASSVNPALTRAQRVNQLQKAHITAAAAIDPRILLIDTFPVYDPPNMSSDTGAQFTHPDMRGGDALGLAIATAISPFIDAATKDQVQEALRNGLYPGMTGTQFDADVLLAGTGGTVPAGVYATGKKATSNLAGTATVTGSKETSGGAHSIQRLTLAGTPAAENTIAQDDTASISATGSTPGAHIMCTWGFNIHDGSGGAPIGLRGLGVTFANFGLFGSSGSDGTTQTFSHALEGIIATIPLGGYGSSGPFAANPAFTTRWDDVILNGSVIDLDRPMVHVVSTLDRPAAYIGYDALLGANYKLRLSGTIAALRVEPGHWSPYGMSNVQFTARRIYLGGTAGGTKSDQGHGTGTLLATLNGSTWTYSASGDGLTAGVSQLYVEIDGNSGVGGTFTARSATAFVPAS